MPSIRSPYDRELLKLAVPAFATLASESTYLLVDTAMVGHLGKEPLAALGLVEALVGTLLGFAVVVMSAITGTVARLHGAGENSLVKSMAAQTLWAGLAVGLMCALFATLGGGLWTDLMGGSGVSAANAQSFMRIIAIGLFFAVVSMAAQGWLRGVGSLKTALVIVAFGNLVNLVLNPLFIYGLDWGLWGSAWATATGQAIMGSSFIFILWRRSAGASRKPVAKLIARISSSSGPLFIRMLALLGSFIGASALATRIGDATLAAHQVGWQLFLFIALMLDAIAIAGQVLIGQALGADNRSGSIEAAKRMTLWAFVLGVLIGAALWIARDPILSIFTNDAGVREQGRGLWPLLCLMMPMGAMVFAFDGVLIGSGDVRYLAYAMVGATAFAVPVMLLGQHTIAGVWTGLLAFIFGRFVGTGLRVLSRRWATSGAWRAGVEPVS